ncbi:MAG TPA: radical SAM protein [Candidatus Onthomonas avicola]|nr:radical SAM protein [Candidatus Onthomonas avicola]
MICNLCPRRCGAVRTETEAGGYCRMPSLPVLARGALHHWEEPPISGTRGSGTIFFSGCPLRCVFCQNSEISQEGFGKPVTPERVREICQELIAQGAHNINFVTPTHYAHVIAQVLRTPLGVPVVYNTGGYERIETLRALEGKVDIYLPDLKYAANADALRYSGAADYVQTAQAAIREMVRQTGPYQLDADGLLTRGVVIRHLILPGKLPAARAVMDWVAETFPPGTVLFSLMSQYLPCGRAAKFPELNRRLRSGERRSAQAYMENLGLEGFTQEPESARNEYIPPFDLTGV